jgi:hypothetical protein
MSGLLKSWDGEIFNRELVLDRLWIKAHQLIQFRRNAVCDMEAEIHGLLK